MSFVFSIEDTPFKIPMREKGVRVCVCVGERERERKRERLKQR
jgi:hypothetical protein